MSERRDRDWVEALPEGWVAGPACARRLIRLLRAELADVDPAPWHSVKT